MRKNIKKRAFAVLLAATLIGNTLQLPGHAMQVTAQERNIEDSEKPISGDTVVSDNNTQEPPEEEQEEALENVIVDEESDTASETQKTGTVTEFMRIGQTFDMDDLPYPGDSDCKYDMPIHLTVSSEVRLFVNWSIADTLNEDDENGVTDWQYSYLGGCGDEEKNDAPKCPYEGVLTWSILRGEAGTVPGTVNLVNCEDDWTDFETVTASPWFTIQEEEDENSDFYKTLTITAGDSDTNDNCNFDYYIRATFQYRKNQTECTAITTVPIKVKTSETEEPEEEEPKATEPETTGAEDRLEPAEPKEELETSKPEKPETTDSEEESGTDAEESGADTEKPDTNTEMEDISAEEQADSTDPASLEEENSETDSAMDSETDSEAGSETDSEVDSETDSEVDSETDSESDSVSDSETAPLTDSDKPSASEEPAASKEPETTVIGISKLTLNKTSAVMNPGDTLKPTVTIVPEGLNLPINWSGSNDEAAVVDNEGNITALAEGRAVITVECGGKTADITIDVVKTDAEKNDDRPKDEEGNVIAISDEVWVAGFERESGAFTYSGNKITQNLRIYHKGTLLKEKTDYVLTYKNNVNAAAYNASKAPSVTITMKGQYTGSRTLYFTIAPRDIDAEHSLGYEQVMKYSKKLKIPAPTLYYGSKKLVLNKDFTCDYSSLPENYTSGDSYEEGAVYEYTVNGIGNFTGSFTMKLSVVKDKNLDFANAVIVLDKKQYEYHGEALSAADVRIISVKLGKTILDADLYEYKVYAEGTGNGYVEVYPNEAGRNEGYRGIKKLKIKVVGDRNIKDAGLGNDWQDSITYSQKKLDSNGGICQEKSGVLTFGEGDGSEVLTEGVDYTAAYSNNKKAGTATVTFKGMGRYTGSLKKTYKILPNTELYVKWHDTDEKGAPVAAYIKGGAIPQFDLLESPEGEETCVLNRKTDYTVKVNNNKKPGVMTCEIIGKGNYKGYKSVTELEVISGDIGQGTIAAADKQYSTKLNAWKSAVTIKDVNGKKLKAGTDYDRNLIYSYAGMEEGVPPKAGTVVYVTAVGIHNYEGTSITGSYRIYSININKLTVCIDAQEYTGKDIELSADDIHVYAGKSDVKKGQEIEERCYEIISYSNNRKAGTAKVTLRGIGDYGGTKVCSFKITKKEYLTTRVTGIALDETSIALGAGNSRQLTATVFPEDAWNKTVIWTTSNSKIAEVNEKGIITAKQPGTVTIRAASQDSGKKASCKVKVSIIPVTSFSLNTEEINQKEGTQYQLTATELQPADATYHTIEWESTNPEIASVDDNGKVSLNKAGMAVIKAYADERQFVRKCLVFVGSEEAAEPEGAYLTPQMFRTFDEDDDTKAFNEAIKNISGDCNTVYIPAGTYRIDAQTGIQLRSNMNFVMSPDAVLQSIDNSEIGYNVIYVKRVSNVTISGGQIAGERYGHGGTAGEWGMGIGLYDSTDIRITDVQISGCWGDGIYIGSEHEEDSDAGCSQITITNCNVYNNRRNNLSIVSADYVTVDECTFKDANGTAPEYGIDIETNNLSNPCEHITISNSTFSGNAQASIGIVTAANDVNISGCILNGSFINYDGTNVTISDTVIHGKMYARIGVSLEGGTKINDGGEEEDILIAAYSADKGSYTLGEYGIDASNRMSCSVIADSDSPSGKALYLKRESEGTKEAGFYLDLSELTEEGEAVLEKGAVYRFEYVVKGSGQWGIKTDQTCWYPCVPMSDKFSTGYTTYAADSAKACRLILYAVDTTEDMYLEIDSIKIYKIR